MEYGTPDFSKCFEIRWAVFVGEQRVPEAEERDGLDAEAWHFLLWRDGVAVATARVLRRADGAAKITRVAVMPAARGAGLGAALMAAVEAKVAAVAFVLDAQTHAVAFYQRLGYAAQGEEFMEAGIPHLHMQKAVRR